MVFSTRFTEGCEMHVVIFLIQVLAIGFRLVLIGLETLFLSYCIFWRPPIIIPVIISNSLNSHTRIG